jgi:type II secretory pathway pseudopilin PulG
MTTPLSARFPASRRAAFTLIELLTVVGLIVVLTGGIALALAGRGGEGAALANSQSLLASLVGATRTQAALHQTTARLLVYAQLPPTGDFNKYLRYLQVVRLETTPQGVSTWVAAGDPVTLPAPICIVPPSPVPANHLNTGVTWNNNAATGPTSIFSPQILTNFTINGQSAAPGGGRPAGGQLFGGTGGGRAYFLEFGPDGNITTNATNNPTKIVVATAVLQPAQVPKFNNAYGVRGLFIRKSGAISLVDEATAF